MFRLGSLLLIVWLAIGALAAYQRDYFRGSQHTCAHVGTVLATIGAGPLNYTGVNPKVHCSLPKPSH